LSQSSIVTEESLAVGKMGFFGASLVAAIPAGFMVYLVVMAFISDGSPEGLLMIMVGMAGLMGLVVALIIPGYILLFVSKSGEIAPPKPKTKKQKKQQGEAAENDDADAEDEFESAEMDADEFDDTQFDDEFEETAIAEGDDEWDDFEDSENK
jgi:hypothetical protein